MGKPIWDIERLTAVLVSSTSPLKRRGCGPTSSPVCKTLLGGTVMPGHDRFELGMLAMGCLLAVIVLALVLFGPEIANMVSSP